MFPYPNKHAITQAIQLHMYMQKHADLVLIVVSIMSVILNDSIGRLVPFDYTLCWLILCVSRS